MRESEASETETSEVDARFDAAASLLPTLPDARDENAAANAAFHSRFSRQGHVVSGASLWPQARRKKVASRGMSALTGNRDEFVAFTVMAGAA